MPRYTKNKLHRFKQLNTHHWELMLGRNNFNVKPGSAIDIVKPGEQPRSYYIASGSQEPWIRLILPETDPWLHYFKSIKPNDSVRVMPDIVEKLPNLYSISQDDVIFCTDQGISPYLSYVSTFISEEIYPTLVYQFKGNGVNLDWIQGRQKVIGGRDLDPLIDQMPKDAKRYFIITNNKSYNKIKKVLPDSAEVIHAEL